MVDATIILTFFLTYKAFKKYGVNGMDRPVNNTWSHMEMFIFIGHIMFILGQHFLLTKNAPLILSTDLVLVLSLSSLIFSDIQDVIFRKKPLWLYSAIMAEYLLWSIIGLVAFMSAQFGEGTLLFIACLSRLADLKNLFDLTVNEKTA